MDKYFPCKMCKKSFLYMLMKRCSHDKCDTVMCENCSYICSKCNTKICDKHAYLVEERYIYCSTCYDN